MTLQPVDVERFVTDGFVCIREAIPAALAAECRERLWLASGVGRDAASWTTPVVRVDYQDAEPFVRAANAPRLCRAFDRLVGEGRWVPRTSLGTFPIRFPSESDPGDAGWHVEAEFERDGRWHVRLRSPGRALLMLFLFSDVGMNDAPTRLLVGSHLDAAKVVHAAGDLGLFYGDVVPKCPQVQQRALAWATGRAGDVYLCHPFLVHAASYPHRGVTPRFMAQPPLPFVDELRIDRSAGDYSPVEQAVRLAVGIASSRELRGDG